MKLDNNDNDNDRSLGVNFISRGVSIIKVFGVEIINELAFEIL